MLARSQACSQDWEADICRLIQKFVPSLESSGWAGEAMRWTGRMGQDGDLMAADNQTAALLCLYLPEDLNIQSLTFSLSPCFLLNLTWAWSRTDHEWDSPKGRPSLVWDGATFLLLSWCQSWILMVELAPLISWYSLLGVQPTRSACPWSC